MSETRYQPYFVAYAHAHGVTPEVMASRTESLRNPDFTAWMQKRWAEFRALRPDCFAAPSRTHEGAVTEAGRAEFGAWLAREPVPVGAIVPAAMAEILASLVDAPGPVSTCDPDFVPMVVE